MRSLAAALRAVVLVLTFVYWAYRALRLLLRVVVRAGDPNAGPPNDIAEALTDVSMDGLSEALADMPPVDVDSAAAAVARASTWGRHTG